MHRLVAFSLLCVVVLPLCDAADRESVALIFEGLHTLAEIAHERGVSSEFEARKWFRDLPCYADMGCMANEDGRAFDDDTERIFLIQHAIVRIEREMESDDRTFSRGDVPLPPRSAQKKDPFF